MAEHRDTPAAALRTAVLVVLVVLAVSVVRDRADGGDLLPAPGAVVIALVGGALLGLATLRCSTTAGPGWLVARHLIGLSWVRTDQLVEVRVGQGIGNVHLRLRDRDGRRLDITWSSIAVSPKLVARLQQDVRASADSGAHLDARSAAMLLRGRR